MPVYPNYSMQMNNPYNIQMQNPYQQRMDFLQNYQQILQPTPMSGSNQQANQQMNVLGKIVDGLEMVKSIEIPMDGMLYYFPKADGTEIYGKQWLSNGQTRILNFKPVLESGSDNSLCDGEKTKFEPSDEFKRVFMERFDNLEKRINELMTKSMTKSTVSKTKKESTDNE